jgi:hypothetical protein
MDSPDSPGRITRSGNVPADHKRGGLHGASGLTEATGPSVQRAGSLSVTLQGGGVRLARG